MERFVISGITRIEGLPLADSLAKLIGIILSADLGRLFVSE